MERLERWKMAQRWTKEVKRAFFQMVKGEEIKGDKDFDWFKVCKREIYNAVSSTFDLRKAEEAEKTLSISLEGLRRFRELLLTVEPEVEFRLLARCHESKIVISHNLSAEVQIAVYGEIGKELNLTESKAWEEDGFKELIKFLNNLEAVLSQLHARAKERIAWLKEPVSSYEEMVGKKTASERKKVPKVALVGGE